MIDSLQLALTAHEVYELTNDAGMIQTAYAALGQLAEMIKQALHDAQAAAVEEAPARPSLWLDDAKGRAAVRPGTAARFFQKAHR